MDRRSETIFRQRVGLEGEESAHHQDSRIANATLPQMDTFFDRTDGQPAGPFRHHDARYFDCPVPVGIGLYDGRGFDTRPYNLADVSVILCDLLPRNQNVGAIRSGHYSYCGIDAMGGSPHNKPQRAIASRGMRKERNVPS